MFPALGFAARFRKICKNKVLRLLGIPPKLIAKSWGLKPFDFRNSREISRSRIPWIPEESREICRLNKRIAQIPYRNSREICRNPQPEPRGSRGNPRIQKKSAASCQHHKPQPPGTRGYSQETARTQRATEPTFLAPRRTFT